MKAKTVRDYLKDIVKIVGISCSHENIGKFRYYTNDRGDVIVVYFDKKNKKFENEDIEINCYYIDIKDSKIGVEFDLNEGIPTEGQLLSIMKMARLNLRGTEKKRKEEAKARLEYREKALKLELKEVKESRKNL